jgi:uncharacterized protein YndB with AHSA1/START domain
MNIIATTETLTISRLIKASRARVFAAWTTPELAQWLCTGERQVISAKVDFRVGGEYNIHLKTANHGEHKFSGAYREIKEPSRIVFTWVLGDCDPEFKDHPTQVTVDFEEQKGGTLVTLTHEGLPTSEIREKHSGGWNYSLDNLEQLV